MTATSKTQYYLWLARAMPFPLTAGDRIYSFKLAAALAEAGADVTFAGLEADVPPQPTQGIHWHVVSDRQRSQPRSLVSTLPLVAARHATAEYRKQATALIQSRQWDAIVIDHYGCGWLQRAVATAEGRPTILFVTHNHETSVAECQWRESAGLNAERAYLWQNWLKTSQLEKQVARGSDLITAITEADAQQFMADAPGIATLVLTPGYDGIRLAARSITANTPRSVVLLGSYLWSAKRASLILFLDQVDAVMAQAGITIEVVGEMDEEFRQKLSARYCAARFHGYVKDPSAYLGAARMAVLAEPVGGGFKLKLLEYIFNRVPIAALTACASGLPANVRAHILLADHIPALIRKVLAEIDNPGSLNALHDGAYRTADPLFDWNDRGLAMLSAVRNRLAWSDR